MKIKNLIEAKKRPWISEVEFHFELDLTEDDKKTITEYFNARLCGSRPVKITAEAYANVDTDRDRYLIDIEFHPYLNLGGDVGPYRYPETPEELDKDIREYIRQHIREYNAA